MLQAGDLIERHRVLRRLGRGGMADVWLVRHAVLGSLNALKVPYGPWADAELVLREGRAQAALDHPNTLPVRDVLTVRGRPALLLPYVDGPSLEGLLAVRRLSAGEATALLLGIAEGLTFAHHAGFVHRDLKPANVLLHLRHDGIHPRIADFGLVKALDDPSHHADGFGTLAYAAPELVHAPRDVDARADWFSFGILAFELYEGERPGPRAPVAGAAVPSAVRDLLFALRHPDPAARPPGHDVLAALRNAPRPTLDRRSALARFIADRRDRTAPVEPTHVPSPALPAQPGPCVGRDQERHAVRAMLTVHRLVTITGLGGIGKSRLALDVAHAVAARFAGGVWWVRAHDAQGPADLAMSVARALGVPLGAVADPSGPVADALWGRGRALVVLDDLPPDPEVASVLHRWLARAPELTLLVTCPLAMPLADQSAFTLEPLSPDAATALFVQRAAEAHPPATLRPDEPGLPELLACLDGNPLALELAAAQVGLYGIGGLTRRVQQNLDVLRSRQGQRSVLAALQGAWDRLGLAEQTGLVQATVFAGSFTLEAASAVLDVPGWVDDVVLELVDHGLLSLRRGEPPRFVVRALVRSFVADQPLDPTIEARHRQWFASRTHPAPHELADLKNAAERAIADGDGATASALARASWRIVQAHGPFVLGTTLLDAACAIAADDIDLHVAAAAAHLKVGPIDVAEAALDRTPAPADDPRVRTLRGELLRNRGELGSARATFEAVLEQPDLPPEVRGRAAMGLGNVLLGLGEHDAAQAAYERAQAALEATGDRAERVTLLGNRAALSFHRGDLADAEERFAQAVTWHRESGQDHLAALLQVNLGSTYRRRGAIERAQTAYAEAAATIRKQGDRRTLGAVTLNLSLVAIERGQVRTGRDALLDARASFRAVGDDYGWGLTVGNEGQIWAIEGAAARADEALREAERIHEGLGYRQVAAKWASMRIVVRLSLGDPEGAVAAAERALAVFEDIGDPGESAWVHARLGGLPGPAGTASLERALAFVKPPTAVRALAGHALARRRVVDRPAEALALLEAHEPDLRATTYLIERCSHLLERAEVSSKLDRLEAAEAALIEAEALHATFELPDDAPLTRRLRTLL